MQTKCWRFSQKMEDDGRNSEMSNPWYRRGDCTLFEYPTWWTLGSKSETVQYIQGKSGFYQKYDKDYRFCA